MNDEINAKHLSIKELAQKCAQETDRFHRQRSYDPQYCFELFQRAIVLDNNDAWDVLYDQYKTEMFGWAWKKSAFQLLKTGEDRDNLIVLAFERFWKYYKPQQFSQAKDLSAVLKYLKICVATEIFEFSRGMEKDQFTTPLEPHHKDTDPKPGDIYQHNELLQYVLSQAKDDKEYTLIYATFVLALPPREIFDEYPAVFDDIDDVNRCKANIIARFKRDSDLRNFLGPDA